MSKWYDIEMSVKKISVLACLMAIIGGFLVLPRTHAVNVTEEPVLVGVTYYGGNWDENRKSWIIDNTDQCNRIKSGEFTARSLNAVTSDLCNDDNGEGYVEGTKLHNKVSFAELSNNPAQKDFSALGNLPLGAKLEISYQGKCLVAEKLDVGQGGGPVNGYQRSLDLWWETARSLDFKNGFDVMSIRKVSDNTPLTEVGKSYPCIQNGDRTDSDIPQASSPGSQPEVMGESSSLTPMSSDSSPADDDKNGIIVVLGVAMVLFSVLALLGFIKHVKK